MIAALGLTGTEQVLEIDAGYGFQIALLARLSRFVRSVERWADLAVGIGSGRSWEACAAMALRTPGAPGWRGLCSGV